MIPYYNFFQIAQPSLEIQSESMPISKCILCSYIVGNNSTLGYDINKQEMSLSNVEVTQDRYIATEGC